VKLWLVASALALALAAGCSAPREYDFYIPDGYVGRVQLRFGVREAKQAAAQQPKEDVVHVPAKTGMTFGYALDPNSKAPVARNGTMRRRYDLGPPHRRGHHAHADHSAQ
jgi:hypothetical protein